MSDFATTIKKIESTITFLEMRTQPTSPTPPMPAEKIAIMRAENPTLEFYRFLYNAVGDDWLWWERRVMADDDLLSIISDPELKIYVFYVRGVPAGFCELDCRKSGSVEIAYFGLIRKFIGRGLGKYFLRWTIDQAWTNNPDRVWVHTCTEDHPAALSTYQKAGFVPYGQETEMIDDPVAVIANLKS